MTVNVNIHEAKQAAAAGLRLVTTDWVLLGLNRDFLVDAGV